MKGVIYCYDHNGETAKVYFSVDTVQELAVAINTIGYIGYTVYNIGDK